MAKKFTKEDDALLAELGVEGKATKVATYTPKQERIIAGFEEIQRFVDEHGRSPEHGENHDIFERLYAVRLDRIRASTECTALLASMDTGGLLSGKDATVDPTPSDEVTDEELLASLGVEVDSETGVTRLEHVRSRAEIKAAEEIAQRNTCEDFERFKSLFEQVQRELKCGNRQTTKYQDNAEAMRDDLFYPRWPEGADCGGGGLVC